ncbi:MAG: type IV secretory system conjugative DNA transfer family protein [Spiribacter salinus]|uniref:Type IV secretory system conjugative DNA transfer family protein n=1 Tax=Spiribacter salinus TaxID=1335746 RepID=A0A540VS75_9GAMM|nr:MAG: type IV secretory system conjugative DNA transfer family protein [Spiribacter salinus]
MGSQLHPILSDAPRGVTARFRYQQSIPSARWLDPHEIKQSTLFSYDPYNPGGKILVGAIDDTLIGIEDDRHILTVAGSRAGKSVSMIGNLLLYRGSVLATDPKAELANITARRRANLGQKVYVLDPFGYTDPAIADLRASYNPLSVLTPDSPTIIEDAGLIAEAIVIQPADQKEPHWDESAKNLIEGIILHVATDGAYEGARDIVTVRELIKTAMMVEEPEDEDTTPLCVRERAMLEQAVTLQDSPRTFDLGAAIEGAARGFYELEAREQANVLSNVRRHTKFLDYSAMRRTLRGHDFDLADLKRAPKGVSVYLCFPATRVAMSNRWLRIFINQLLDAMEREKTQPAAPVLACLDEFPVLGYMRQLEAAAGQISAFGVKLWVVIQDWGQGKTLYQDRWETFVGNAGVLQFFGNNDLATTEYISRRLGKTPVEVTRRGDVGADQSQRGQTGQQQVSELHDLLAADEVARLFARSDPKKRQLVIWAGYHPMVLQRVEYFDQDGPLGKMLRE